MVILSRAKHLHVGRKQRLKKYIRRVDQMSEEAEIRNAKLKKKKGVERWYAVEAIGPAPDAHTYPPIGVVYHEVKLR